jgi:penicillin-binding protein 1C
VSRLSDVLRPYPRAGAALSGVALASLLGAVVLGLAFSQPLPDRLLSEPSAVVRYRDGTPAHVFLADDGRRRIAVTPNAVDPAYVSALIRLEDRRFGQHLGVDPVAVVRAAVTNVRRGRVVSGASTITMQVVRLCEPRPRTLRSKLVEATRAVQLELRLSKAEILAAYLQLTPFGRNLEGVEAASLAYFGHSAGALSAGEIATLLAVPQNPNARYPSTRNSSRLASARDEVARRLAEVGELPRGATPEADGVLLARVLGSPVPGALRPVPREVPHTAYWLRAAEPERREWRTSLDRGAQRVAEDVLAAARPGLERKGIDNGAIVVLDTASAEVLALGGNLSFWDDSRGRRIAAFDVPRSPGSTLKPLVYAAAIDRGDALPEFLVPDVPTAFGSYVPRNYDGGFDGLVRLDDALSRSLNVPFIHLLRDVGVDPFLGILRDLGVGTLADDPNHYGLSVAVGGVELTPLELAGAYAALARGGRAQSPRWLLDTESDSGAQPLSEGATWLTRRALERRDRPDFPGRADLSAATTGIHWKTGTSTGRRDAWAVGSGPKHTVAVWLGNLDNRGSAALVGADAAGPLLFDVLGALAPGGTPVVDPVPDDLGWVEVCSYSGRRASEACPHRTDVRAVVANVPTEVCPYHRRVDVDVESGLAVSAQCREGRLTEPRTVLTWPASTRRYLRASARLLPSAPSWAPGCEPAATSAAPVIVSPPEGQAAVLIAGLSAHEQQIPLQAESDADGALAWFVNGRFLGSSPADGRVWWTPALGEHRIVVTDGQGRSTHRAFAVLSRP